MCIECGKEYPNIKYYFDGAGGKSNPNVCCVCKREKQRKRIKEYIDKKKQDPEWVEEQKIKYETRKEQTRIERERQRKEKWKHYNVTPQQRFDYQCINSIESSFYRKGFLQPENPWDIVGLPLNEYEEHLLRTWYNTYGYEWDMEEEAHIDHIIPLKEAETVDDVMRLCHFSNLRLIRAVDNLRKGERCDYAVGDDAK